MESLRIIQADEVRSVGDSAELMREMKSAYSAGLRRSAITPARIAATHDNPFSVFGVMPSISVGLGIFSTKILTLREIGTASCGTSLGPAIQGLTVIFSTASGKPIAVLDGAAATNLKCAAVTGLITDICAPQGASRLGIIGAGALALEQARGIAAVRTLDAVTVYCRTAARFAEFASELRQIFVGKTAIVCAQEIAEAVRSQDIVCTATSSSAPLLDGADLSAHAHVNCMGAHSRESREVPEAILKESVLIVEDLNTAQAEGGPAHADAVEIEELLTMDKAALHSERTVFSSTGHAFLDLLTASHVLRRAGAEPDRI